MDALIKLVFSFLLFIHGLVLQIYNLFKAGVEDRPVPESTSKMQAWQIQFYGDVKQLQLAPITIPYISKPGQLLIKVKATSLNPIDLYMLGGYGKSLIGLLRWYQNEFPLILGREFAGTIVAKGSGISDNEFKVGDDVYGIIPPQIQGSQAEYVLADKSHVLLQPSDLTPIEASSILYASITAWSALFVSGKLATLDPAKTKVLVLGASGGVGTLATQILKSQGVTVIGVCATDAVSLVTSLGADYVYSYKQPDHIINVAVHGTYDIILDCAKYGYEKIPNDWKYRTYITLNAPVLNDADRFGIVVGLTLSALKLICANIPRVFSGQSVKWGFFSPQSDAFHLIDKLVRNKQLKPVVQKVFKFEEVPEAYKMLATGHLRGKIVIDLQQVN